MNTNIKTNDAIIYSGSVHIQYRYGKKTRHINRHNKGELPLFTAIVFALGDRTEEAKSYMPKYIMALDDNRPPTDQNCLTSKLLLQDRKYYNDGTLENGGGANTIRYTFVIPVANMYPNRDINKLQLINERDEVCAEIDLEEGREINTNIGANLLIYWDLTFTDSSQSE